jgi:predicted O-methyltransferase YrrM
MNPNAAFDNWYHRVPGKFYTHPIPRNFTEIYGFCNFVDLYQRAVTNMPDNALAVEIGTLAGHSAALMATLINQSQKYINFYSIDPLPDLFGDDSVNYYSQEFDIPMYDLFLRNIKSLGMQHYITQMRIKSVPASKLFADNSVDFLFIDGDHTYEGALEDIKTWLPKMKAKSIIAGHDYDHPTVRRAVDEVFSANDIQIMTTSWYVELNNSKIHSNNPVTTIKSSVL